MIRNTFLRQTQPVSSFRLAAPLLTVARLQCSSTASAASSATTKKSVDADKNKKESGYFTTEKKEKMLTGALSAGITACTTMTVCHLVVVPVGLDICAGAVLGSSLTGALAAFEGGESGGTGFGALIGLFIGGFACYYAKNQNVPWSSAKKK